MPHLMVESVEILIGGSKRADKLSCIVGEAISSVTWRAMDENGNEMEELECEDCRLEVSWASDDAAEAGTSRKVKRRRKEVHKLDSSRNLPDISLELHSVETNYSIALTIGGATFRDEFTVQTLPEDPVAW